MKSSNVPDTEKYNFGIICPGQYLQNISNHHYKVVCVECYHEIPLDEMKYHVQQYHGVDVNVTCPWCVKYTWVSGDGDKLADYMHVKNCELCLTKSFGDKSMGYAVFCHLISCLRRRCFDDAVISHSLFVEVDDNTWTALDTDEDLAEGYCISDLEEEESMDTWTDYDDSDDDSSRYEYDSDDDGNYVRAEGVEAG